MKRNTVIVGAVLVVAGFVGAAEDLLDNVQWVTVNAQRAVHSFPAFSEDGRYIFATGQGSAYDSSCDHVYRFDRALDSPQPVSLVSTGIGTERGTAVNYALSTDSEAKEKLYTVVSNAEVVEKADVDLIVSPEWTYCREAPTKCRDPANAATCGSLFIERYPGSINYAVTPALGLKKLYSMTDLTLWDSLRTGSDKYMIGTRLNGDNEQIRIIDGSKIKNLKHEVAWADGFTIDKESKRAYYSAAPRPGTIKTGLTSVAAGRLYMVNILDADPAETLVATHNDHAYLWPSLSPGNPKVLIATRLTIATGARAVVRFKLNDDGTIESATAGVTDGNEEVLAEDAWQGQLSPDGKLLTFVSSRDSRPHQVYVASVKNVAADKPTMDPPAKRPAVTHSIGDFEHLTNGWQFLLDHFMHMPTSVRISGDKETIMFATDTKPGNCPQVYQIGRQSTEDFAFRKMTSGIQVFSSPDFISNSKNILYSGALQRAYNQKDGCVKTCADPAFFKANCEKGKRVRLIPKESEILEGNPFGSIVQRWTSNAVWDGESRVAPNGKTAVFLRRDGNGFKLFRLKFDAPKEAKFLEEEIVFEANQKNSFIFDISFDADSKKLVYARSRLVDSDAANQKILEDLLAVELVHIPYSSIFMYDLVTKKEHLLGKIDPTEDVTMALHGDRYVAIGPTGVTTAVFEEKKPVPPPPKCPPPPDCPPPPAKNDTTTTTVKPKEEEDKETKKKKKNSATTAAASFMALGAAVLLKAF